MLLPWSAECAEFVSIVIELVIGIYPLQTTTCLLFSITNYITCCEVKLQLQITVFENLKSLHTLSVLIYQWQ